MTDNEHEVVTSYTGPIVSLVEMGLHCYSETGLN